MNKKNKYLFCILMIAVAGTYITSTTYVAKALAARDLRLGSTGQDVTQLQHFLNVHNFLIATTGPGSLGNETTYFGTKTKNALRKIQEFFADFILKPIGLTKGTGILSTQTRSFINSKRLEEKLAPTTTPILQPTSTPLILIAPTSTATSTAKNSPIFSGSSGRGVRSNGGGTDSPTDFTIGGTISNLTGTLILQNNSGDNLSISSGSNFTFTTPLTNGSTYNVTILSQPAGQFCSALNNTGTVSSNNVTSITIPCLTIPVLVATDIDVTDPTLFSPYDLQDYVTSTDPVPGGGYGCTTLSSSVECSGSTVYAITASSTTSTIHVIQSGSGNFTSGSTTLLFITHFSPVPTISNFNNITKSYGDAPFSLAATSTSAGAITYTSGDTSIATIAGSTVTIHKGGTTTLTAHQSASGGYASTTSSLTLTVNLAFPSVTFQNFSVVYDGSPYLVQATSTSNADYYYLSGNENIFTVSGPAYNNSFINILSAGTTTISRVNVDNEYYESNFSQAIITVSTTCATSLCSTPAYGSYGTCTMGTGGGYSCACATPGMTGSRCALATDQCATMPCGIHGMCVRTSTLSGMNPPLNSHICACDTGYSGDDCSVPAVDPTISFAPIIKYFSGSIFDFLFTPSSNSAGVFSYASSNNSVATVSGGMCTVQGIGSSTITANQAGASGYNSGSTTTLLQVYDNYCAANPNPCQNGGTCSPYLNSYTCSCAVGFGGETCGQTFDTYACYTSPEDVDACSNQGTCQADGSGGTCECNPCFIGPTCSEFDTLNCA